MKKFNFTKRELGFFFLGMFAFFLIETIVFWDEAKAAFWKGYNETRIELDK